MNKNKRSIGQGYLRSRPDLRPAGLSVVQRLATRSVTGRGPNINVHQHFGWRLHLEWTNGEERRCFERFFETFESIDEFCLDLAKGGAEGLCDCVHDKLRLDLYDGGWAEVCDCGECDCLDRIARLFEVGKVQLCRLEPVPQSQKYYYRFGDILTSWTKQLHELDPHRYRCHCPISSTEL